MEKIYLNEYEIDILIASLTNYKVQPHLYFNKLEKEKIDKLINKITFNNEVH